MMSPRRDGMGSLTLDVSRSVREQKIDHVQLNIAAVSPEAGKVCCIGGFS